MSVPSSTRTSFRAIISSDFFPCYYRLWFLSLLFSILFLLWYYQFWLLCVILWALTYLHFNINSDLVVPLSLHFFSDSFHCCYVYCVYLSCMWFSIMATCPSMLAARFAFWLCFIRFNFVVRSGFVGEPKQSQRARFGRSQTSSSP